MWTKPGYTPPDRHRSSPKAPPPEDTARRLATLERQATGEEVRIGVAEMNGHPYVSCWVWYRDDEGRWRPSKKGFSIRRRELGEVLEALHRAVDFLDGTGPGPEGRDRPPTCWDRPGRRPRPPGECPTPGRGELPFDEFG